MDDSAQDQHRTVITQADVDAQGRLPLRDRFHHVMHREVNSRNKTCGSVPCCSRLPDVRLTVLVLGAETPYGSHLVRGLTNPAYSPAFDVQQMEVAAVQQCRDAASLAESFRGAHTIIAAGSFIVQDRAAGDRYVDLYDDTMWQMLLDACVMAKVKRFVPSPFEWDLQLAHPPKKNKQSPELIRRAMERRLLLTDPADKKQKKKDGLLIDYILISVGLLTERLFSPLEGVDVANGVVRAPAGLGWQTRVTTTTLDDLARMLPEILLSSDSNNAKVHLCSSTVTYEEIALLVEEMTGKSVRREELTISEEQRQAAFREHTTDATATMNVLLDESSGLWWTKGNSWNAGYIPHVPTTSIRDWAQQHLKQSDAPAGPTCQPNLHTTPTGFAPIHPTPAELYFSVATA